MGPAARRFHLRYAVLTSLLPALALAALFYSAAYFTLSSLLHSGGASLGFAGVLLLGAAPLLEGCGFMLSGIPRARSRPRPGDGDGIAALQLALREFSERLALLPPAVALVELGAVPYVAAGAGAQPLLWISGFSLRGTAAADLRCIAAHELAHLSQQPGCLQRALSDIAWLLAYPVVYLLGADPLLTAAAAVAHAGVQLRVKAAQGRRAEAVADRLAIELTAEAGYLASLARTLAAYETPERDGRSGTALRRSRLRALGLSRARIDELLAAAGG